MAAVASPLPDGLGSPLPASAANGISGGAGGSASLAPEGAKFPTGMVLPPPDIRSIVDKTANFVANSEHGLAFEEKIRERERANAKFAFLNSADAYHPYYRWKIERIKAGDVVDVKPSAATPTHAAPAAPVKAAPVEPPPHEFETDMPNISGVDLDIIRLTALFTARRSRPFISTLTAKETRNPQFDFLRPNHSLFGFFNRLVEQYTKVLTGSAWRGDELQGSVMARKKAIVERAGQRAEWENYRRERARKKEEESEKERIAFASIDWQDFVVVETIEFTESDSSIDLPAPMSIKEIESMTLAQKRMASLIQEEEPVPEIQVKGGAGGEDSDVEMDVSDEEEDEEERKKKAEGRKREEEERRAREVQASMMAAPEGMKIKTDYVPKSKKAPDVPPGYSKSPISGQLVPNEEFANHLRIELLDPKWQERRELAEARRAASQMLQQGADVAGSLKSLSRQRDDIFGQDDEEARAKRRAAEEEAQRARRARETGVWDGHTGTAEVVTNRYQAAANLESQIEAIHARRGLVPEEPGAGPRVGPAVVPPTALSSLPAAPAPRDPSASTFSAGPAPPSAQQYIPPATLPVIHYPAAPTAPGIHPDRLAAMAAGGDSPAAPGSPMPPSGPRADAGSPFNAGLVRSADEMMGGAPGEDEHAAKRPRVAKLPEGQFYPEEEWMKFHPENSITLSIQMPSMPDKPEWGCTGQTLTIPGLRLDHIVATLRERILAANDGRGPPAARIRLNAGSTTLTNSKTLASYNFEDGDQVNLSVRDAKKK